MVEYKQRAERDDDDEYDDFGRRKKRRNPGSSIHSEDSYQGKMLFYSPQKRPRKCSTYFGTSLKSIPYLVRTRAVDFEKDLKSTRLFL